MENEAILRRFESCADVIETTAGIGVASPYGQTYARAGCNHAKDIRCLCKQIRAELKDEHQ